MPEYRVEIPAGGWYSVRVDTENIEGYDGTEGPNTDLILEAAYDLLPVGGVCAQCSGWNQKWSFAAGADVEAKVITTEPDTGEDVVIWGSWDNE